MSELDLNFVADRVAEVDALVTFIINAAQSSKDFTDFQSTLQKGVGEVKITAALDIESWLADKSEGFVVLGRFNKNEPLDFFRDDEDALPVIFTEKTDAMIAAGINTFDVVRVRDLAEEYEKRNA